jgi:D-arabinose 1-dehydrogenase-like Zn-dependent alcohol dehydrogenase
LSNVLRARGASWIGVSEPSIERRKMAAEHKASAIYDPRAQDVVAETFKATGNKGADVVYDCAGIQATLDVALKAVRPRGNLMNIAIWDDPATIHFNNILFKEITITGKCSSSGSLQCSLLPFCKVSSDMTAFMLKSFRRWVKANSKDSRSLSPRRSPCKMSSTRGSRLSWLRKILRVCMCYTGVCCSLTPTILTVKILVHP